MRGLGAGLAWVALVAGSPGLAVAQGGVPEYTITAEVADGWVRGGVEVVVPAALAAEWGGVALDTAGLGVAAVERVSTEEGVRLRADFAMALDSADLGPLGYFLVPADAPGARWYPEAVGAGGQYANFADYRVQLAWPVGVEVLTTGAGERTTDGDRVEARFRARHVEGFTLMVAPGHERVVLGDDGLQIEVVAPPELVETYTAAGRRALEAAAYYRELYGFFPKERLGIIPGPAGYVGGWPLPDLFMIHRGNLGEEYVRFITAHELGHYYWGHYVLTDAPDRLDWLVLANGIWADQLYLADHHGRSLEAQWRAVGNGNWMRRYVRAQLGNRDQTLGLSRARAADLGYDYNSLVRHGKAATGLYLLARRMGADRFTDVQRTLLREFRYRPLPADTFAQRLEAAGAEGAAAFLDAWRRTDATIGYEVLDVRSRADDAGVHDIVIRRVGTVPYPVPMEAVGANGARAAVEYDPAARADTATVALPGPITVVQDPDGAVPTWNGEHPGIQRLYLLALYDLGWMRPFRALAESYLSEHDDPEIRRRLDP